MSDILKLIQEADVIAFELESARNEIETAKRALETAKENFETTKKSYEDVLSKADEFGVPKARFRKLMDERTQVLVASGIVMSDAPASAKPAKFAKPKAPKKSAIIESEDEVTEMETEESEAAAFN